MTERLWLRPIMAGDAAAIFDLYASSPAATKFMNFKRLTSLDASSAWVARCLMCWQNGSAYPWAVIEKSTSQFLGSIELRIDPPRADFGNIYGEKFWGRGFATEAARVVVDWAYAQPVIYRVWATCFVENIASAKVLAKSGLTFEARLENWEARPQLGSPAGPSLMFAKTMPIATS